MKSWGWGPGPIGSVPLLEKIPESLYFLFFPCEDTRKKAGKPGRELSPGTKWSSTLILGVPASRTEEINFWYLSHPIYGIMLRQPKLTNKQVKLDIGHIREINALGIGHCNKEKVLCLMCGVCLWLLLFLIREQMSIEIFVLWRHL